MTGDSIFSSAHFYPHRISHWLLVFLFAFFSPTLGQAQSAKGQEEITLPPVTIKATRSSRDMRKVPASITRLSVAQNGSTGPGLSLDESLQTVPGLYLQNPFNFAQDIRISLRGFGARAAFGVRGVRILLDGFPQTLPDGQSQVDSLMPALLNHAEILRGPSSSLYGNASGGVVSLYTRDGSDNPVALDTGFHTGQFGLVRSSVEAGGTRGAWNYLVHGTHLRMDGYRVHSGVESSIGHFKIKYTGKAGGEWLVTARHFDSPRAEDPGGLNMLETNSSRNQASPRNLTFNAGEEVKQSFLGIRHTQQWAAHTETQWSLFLGQRDFNGRLPFVNGGQVTFDRWNPGISASVNWDAPVALVPLRVIAGVDYQYQRDDRRNFENNSGIRGDLTLAQLEEVHNVGPFLRTEIDPGNKLYLAAGLRYDQVRFSVEDQFIPDGDQTGSRSMSQWNWNAGGIYAIRSDLQIFINAATSFETPTTTELVNNPGGTGGFNLLLNPQESTQVEAGLRGQGKLAWEAVAFWTQTENEIVPFQLAAFPGRSFFQNSGESRRIGLESSLEMELNNYFNLSLAYTWSDFEFVRFSNGAVSLRGNDLPGIPQHLLETKLNFAHPQGWFGRVRLDYVGDQYADNQNETRNPSYVRGDLVAGWKRDWKTWSLQVYGGVNNFLNETYNANVRINAAAGRYFEPAPPVHGVLGVQATWRPEG